MSINLSVRRALVALTCGTAAFAANAATTYHITDLGRGTATGVNDLGQVVGHEFGVGGFVTGPDGGARQLLSPLAGFDSVSPMGINNAGEIVGVLGAGSGFGLTQSVFTYSAGQGALKNLGTLGGTRVESLDIGDGGYVVGISTNADGIKQLLFKRAGSDTLETQSPVAGAPVDVLSQIRAPHVNASGQVSVTYGSQGVQSYASGPDGKGFKLREDGSKDLFLGGINDAGQIAAASCMNMIGCQGGVVNADGSFTALDNALAGAPSLKPSDINNLGQIAGTYESRNVLPKVFLSQADGKGIQGIEDMSFDNPDVLAGIQAVAGSTFPGVTFSSIAGLNNLGQLVLNGGDGRIYMLSPVPEPATAVSMLLGLGLTAGLVAHRRRAAIRVSALQLT